MSSTTERLRRLFRRPARPGRRPDRNARRADRGQVLVIFAFGSIGILAVAALVFDVGQNLFERRKQQDAADASALAGACWMTTPACRARESIATCPEAYNAALALATTHGYQASQVTINIPPTSGPFGGYPGHLQVAIDAKRGSYFAGVVGISSFRVGASAVASNIKDYPPIGSSSVPRPPAAMVVTGAHAGSNRPPSGCPGSTSPATAANPRGYDINFNREKVVWIYPGVYYGGLKLRETSQQLTVYMAPGIYYLAGGGFEVAGALTLKSVEAATALVPFPTTFGGGVLIYNTDNPACAGCGASAIKAIDFQNTTGGEVRLTGYTGPTYTHMLLWQDRNASLQPAVAITGNSSMTLNGTIYIPKADFKYTGNGGGEVLDAQVICDEFVVGGNGTLTIAYDPDEAVRIGGVGLVQ